MVVQVDRNFEAQELAAAVVAGLVAGIRGDGGASPGLATRGLGYGGGMSTAAETPEGRAERIEMWRDPDGRWRWSYRASGLELLGNDSFAAAGAARRAATAAYPGVDVLEVAGAEEPRARPAPRPARKEALLMLLLAAILGGLVVFARRRAAPRHD
jgi:hypothetical protein